MSLIQECLWCEFTPEGPWRRNWAQDVGRLNCLCKVSALQAGGLLWYLQNARDFWEPTCSVRLLINNKCSPPSLWTHCIAVYASAFKHQSICCWSQEWFLQYLSQARVLDYSLILGVFPWLVCCTCYKQSLELRGRKLRWAVRAEEMSCGVEQVCYRVCWCFLQVNAITKDKTSPTER